jgi:hypothetical protein
MFYVGPYWVPVRLGPIVNDKKDKNDKDKDEQDEHKDKDEHEDNAKYNNKPMSDWAIVRNHDDIERDKKRLKT